MTKNKNIFWSLKIPINLNKVDNEIKEYLTVCEKKLGIVPNILKTNTIDIKNSKLLILIITDLCKMKIFLIK